MSLAIHRIITVTDGQICNGFYRCLVISCTDRNEWSHIFAGDCPYILQNHFVEISPCDVHHSYERLRSKLKLVNTGLFSSVGFFTFC